MMEASEMSAQELIATAKAMVADGKGLLAMDESSPTCKKRFEKVIILNLVFNSQFRVLIVIK
jgi:fructose-bisphosphate aldolase class I